jgi:hypothetical protein
VIVEKIKPRSSTECVLLLLQSVLQINLLEPGTKRLFVEVQLISTNIVDIKNAIAITIILFIPIPYLLFYPSLVTVQSNSKGMTARLQVSDNEYTLGITSNDDNILIIVWQTFNHMTLFPRDTIAQTEGYKRGGERLLLHSHFN